MAAVVSGASLLVAAVPSRAAPLGPTVETIYSFADYESPPGDLTPGPGGVLYGVSFGYSTVFQLAPPSAPGYPWTRTTLFEFPAGGHAGMLPSSKLTLDGTGALYGTTASGTQPNDAGAVFRLEPPAAAGSGWTIQTLHEFGSRYNTAGEPIGPLLRAPQLGHPVYGETTGSDEQACHLGTVYRLTKPAIQGHGWDDSSFEFNDCSGALGADPNGALVLGQDGALYGTTAFGGSDASGTVFKLVPPTAPGDAWSETVLHNFVGSTDGNGPRGLISDGAGGFFGTAVLGGPGYGGTVFHLAPPLTPGAAWSIAVIHGFEARYSKNGADPNADLTLTEAGDLYGTTYAGGIKGAGPFRQGAGTIFKLLTPTTPGGIWREVVIYRFTGMADGGQPYTGMVRDKAGIFYGTTERGGTAGAGVVFSFFP